MSAALELPPAIQRQSISRRVHWPLRGVLCCLLNFGVATTQPLEAVETCAVADPAKSPLTNHWGASATSDCAIESGKTAWAPEASASDAPSQARGNGEQ